MKCLIINASPRKGNSYALVKIAKQKMQSMGAVDFEEIHLGKTDIPLCVGCFNCFLKGEDKCPHHTLVAPIAQAIEACDCLMICCPIYSLALTAHLKNVFDHMSYNFHRPRFFEKKAFVITTTAGAGAKSVAKYIRDVLKHWGFNRVLTYSIACRSAGGYQATPKVKQKIEQTAKIFYEDVASGKLHRPTLKRVMYYNAWRAMANANKDGCDYRYWKETDMLDSMFAKAMKLGIAGKLFGRFIYAIFRRVM